MKKAEVKRVRIHKQDGYVYSPIPASVMKGDALVVDFKVDGEVVKVVSIREDIFAKLKQDLHRARLSSAQYKFKFNHWKSLAKSGAEIFKKLESDYNALVVVDASKFELIQKLENEQKQLFDEMQTLRNEKVLLLETVDEKLATIKDLENKQAKLKGRNRFNLIISLITILCLIAALIIINR